MTWLRPTDYDYRANASCACDWCGNTYGGPDGDEAGPHMCAECVQEALDAPTLEQP